MLSRRPDYDQGKLVPLEECWSVDFPEGSHRIKRSWHQDRLLWVDEDGKPLAPEWKVPLQQGFEEQSEDVFHGPEGAKEQLKSWSALDEDQIKEWDQKGELGRSEVQVKLEFDAHDEDDLSVALACMRASDLSKVKHSECKAGPLPKVKRMSSAAFDPNLTSQRPCKKAKEQSKAKENAKINQALKTLTKAKKTDLDKCVEKLGRRKTLAAIIPGLATATLSKKQVRQQLKATKGVRVRMIKLKALAQKVGRKFPTAKEPDAEATAEDLAPSSSRVV